MRFNTNKNKLAVVRQQPRSREGRKKRDSQRQRIMVGVAEDTATLKNGLDPCLHPGGANRQYMGCVCFQLRRCSGDRRRGILHFCHGKFLLYEGAIKS